MYGLCSFNNELLLRNCNKKDYKILLRRQLFMKTLTKEEIKQINGGKETGCSGNFEEDGIMCNIGQGVGNLVNKIQGK